MTIEEEIRQICAAGIRGQFIPIRRAEELLKRYPDLYNRISDEERDKAHDEMNPMAKKDSANHS